MPDSVFYALYHHGYARVAACTLPVALADPATNKERILEAAKNSDEQGCSLCVFPELSLTGYSLDDLRQQEVLLTETETALTELAAATIDLLPMLIVGAALRHGSALCNCAVVLHRGKILGVVPKSYLPNYREFYEARQFTACAQLRNETIRIGKYAVPFGTNLLFEAADIAHFCVAIEICEDMWVPVSPGSVAALAGATILANPSASDITVGKAETRDLLCRSQSARCLSAYIYAAAGEGESTTDVAWDGQISIFENGQLLAESERFPSGSRVITADIDLMLLAQERMRMGSFTANARAVAGDTSAWQRITSTFTPPLTNLGLRRPLNRFPFVPSDPHRLEQDCFEAFTIQVSALKQRLRNSGVKTMVIGISGGLDSTQALLTAVRAADEMGWPRTSVLAYTMPGFGTTDKTLASANILMETLGTTHEVLDIRPAASLMLRDIDHPFAKGEAVHDVTFENVQAGLRTDFLFRLANKHNGLVIGTGDLSELALGWCTYGVGDQMSHYNVNAGLPKTLIQHLIRWAITSGYFSQTVSPVLTTILNTEISPELIPATNGKIQSTEDTIGPYALHDFTLFYILRYGLPPSRIAFMALQAWQNAEEDSWPPGFPDAERKAYDLVTIRHWLGKFLYRFFTTSQFKRSAMPNGPKIMAGGSLSPRGDWRAPSDGNARLWLDELERNVP